MARSRSIRSPGTSGFLAASADEPRPRRRGARRRSRQRLQRGGASAAVAGLPGEALLAHLQPVGAGGEGVEDEVDAAVTIGEGDADLRATCSACRRPCARRWRRRRVACGWRRSQVRSCSTSRLGFVRADRAERGEGGASGGPRGNPRRTTIAARLSGSADGGTPDGRSGPGAGRLRAARRCDSDARLPAPPHGGGAGSISHG